MNKEDIIKFIDGIPFYRYEYTYFLYQKLEEKDKEIERLNNIIDEIESIVYANISNIDVRISIQDVLDKLKELKEGK